MAERQRSEDEDSKSNPFSFSNFVQKQDEAITDTSKYSLIVFFITKMKVVTNRPFQNCRRHCFVSLGIQALLSSEIQSLEQVKSAWYSLTVTV